MTILLCALVALFFICLPAFASEFITRVLEKRSAKRNARAFKTYSSQPQFFLEILWPSPDDDRWEWMESGMWGESKVAQIIEENSNFIVSASFLCLNSANIYLEDLRGNYDEFFVADKYVLKVLHMIGEREKKQKIEAMRKEGMRQLT